MSIRSDTDGQAFRDSKSVSVHQRERDFRGEGIKELSYGVTYGIRVCPMCGSEFVARSSNMKRCSDCRRLNNNRLNLDRYYAKLGRPLPEHKAIERKPKVEKPKPMGIDNRVRYLRSQGLTYAEAQTLKTKEMYARVEI